jgi:hypothetical protein
MQLPILYPQCINSHPRHTAQLVIYLLFNAIARLLQYPIRDRDEAKTSLFYDNIDRT